MQFIKRSKYHADSECGRYTINRANGVAGSGSYMAVRAGKPDAIIAVHRFSDDDGRGDAYKAAVAACEGDAGE